MFGNFIYFILALLVYTIHRPTDQPAFGPGQALVLAILLSAIFYIFVKLQFKRVMVLAKQSDSAQMDHIFSTTLTRQSILALIVYSIDIHGLHLPSHIPDYFFITTIPTLKALLFIILFIFYLVIVWSSAHDAYEYVYGQDISKRQYIHTQIALSIPVLLPWLLLSGVSDIIRLLPFSWAQGILDTPSGQAVYFSVFLVVATVFGPVLIQKFWNCSPLEPGQFRTRIERLTGRAGLTYRNILLWPIFGGRMITAGVMGLVGRFRYILVTEALKSLLEPEEIDAVIAHEIGHIKRKHLLFYLFFFIGFMVISYATLDFIVYLLVFSNPLQIVLSRYKLNPATFTSIIYALTFFLNVIVYFRFVFGYFMRNFERQADTYVFTLFNTAIPLITTFKKIIAYSGQAPEKPNWHHFSIAQRMDFLRSCELDRSWIKRHDRKVKRSIIIYCLALSLMVFGSWQLNFGQIGQRLNLHLFERLVATKQPHTAQDSILYFMIGNAYYEMQNLEKAAEAYEKSLELNPDQPEVLNNLAWLLATSKNNVIYNPLKALRIARKAASMKQSSHILDTLAEALFVNGQTDKAIAVEKQAIALAPPQQRTLYVNQLEKFLKAAKVNNLDR